MVYMVLLCLLVDSSNFSLYLFEVSLELVNLAVEFFDEVRTRLALA